MNVFIEDFTSSSSFIKFEIGKKLNLDFYKEGLDYNTIRSEENGSGYYFFNSEIDFELYEQNGIVSSFDILLRNQENQLFLGKENLSNFELNNCKLDELLIYINKMDIQWRFSEILSDKSISIIFYKELQFILYFDFNIDMASSLTLIHLSKIISLPPIGSRVEGRQ